MAAKIVTNNFILYSLNRHRNFLKAPVCECGCGQKMYLQLEDEIAVVDFCLEMLAESECEHPGMFAVFQDGVYMALTIIYDEEEEDLKIFMGKKRDMHFFSEFDADFCLHCYGLICEVRPGEWMIQE